MCVDWLDRLCAAEKQKELKSLSWLGRSFAVLTALLSKYSTGVLKVYVY